MKSVFVIGGTTFDHIISVKDFPKPIPQTIHNVSFYEATGSTGAGKALSLKKLDVPTVLYSVLGNDQYGKQIINYLEKEKVNFIYDIDPKGTERHINIMDSNGGRISMFITQSSEKPEISVNKIEKEIINADIIVLNIISYCKEIIPFLQKKQKPIWTDLHDYIDGNEYHKPFIDIADYIFLSSDNLNDYKQTMLKLIEDGKELVVCTHGKRGATALTKSGKWIDEPAISNFKLVDSNGAGDNFFSGFLWAYLTGKPINECMKYASICGALCITSKQLVYKNLTLNLLQDTYSKIY